MTRLSAEHRALLALVRMSTPPASPAAGDAAGAPSRGAADPQRGGPAEDARPQPGMKEQVGGVRAGELDWARVADLAIHNNLAALLHRRLTDGSLALPAGLSPPAEVLRRLQQDYLFSWMQCELLQRAFEDIARELYAKGLPVLPLKGVLFGSSLYPSPELRTMVDVDVLARPGNMDAIGELILAKGYSASSPPVRPITQREMFEKRFVKQVGRFKILIEVHEALGQRTRYRVDYESLWARALPAVRLGAAWVEPILAMSAEDNLLHLCLHQSNHVFDETDLRSVLDFHEIVLQWRPDWRVVVQRAAQWGVLTALHVAGSTARHLLETPVPAWVLSASRPRGPRAAWLDFVLDRQGLGSYRFPGHPSWLKKALVGFALMDRASDRFRFARYYAGLRIRDALAARAGRSARAARPSSPP